MQPRTKFGVTLVLLLAMAGIGTADYYANNGALTASIMQPGNSGAVSSQASSQIAVPTPDLTSAIQEAGLTVGGSDAENLLTQIAGSNGARVESYTLLSHNDRAGSVAAITSSDVQTLYINLKEALLGAFSSGVSELKDEIVQNPGQPVKYMLSFRDPAISEERLVFYVAGHTLYEFRLREGNEEAMYILIQLLTETERP